MKELILLVGRAKLPPDLEFRRDSGGTAASGRTVGRLPEQITENHMQRVVAHWNSCDAASGHISLPARLRADLSAIRAEHMAWAYDLGRLRLGGREVQERLKAGGDLSMWWCSLLYERHPKMTPGLYMVYKLRALERLMDEGGFTVLRLCGGDALLRHALAEFCAASGRLFVEFHEPGARLKPAQSLLRRVYNACPAPFRAVARYAHWWWTVRRRLPCACGRNALQPPASAQAPTATIATYFPNVDMHAAGLGRFRSRYWEKLHDALNAQARREGAPPYHFVRWLFIRFPAPELSFDQCLKLRDRFRQEGRDGLSFHYLEEFLRHRDLWAALWRHLRLSLTSLRLEKKVRPAFCFAGSRLNFWDYLGPYWAESFRGWRGLERCLQYRGLKNYVRNAGLQRWTLFPLENCPWERMLSEAVHAARGQAGGPVYGAQHSAIRPTDFRYFDDPRTFRTVDCAAFQPDAVRGNGQSACRQWLDAGMPPEILGEVEALRYLYLAEADMPNRQTADAPDKADGLGGPLASNALQAAGSKRLLVVTSFFQDETEAHLVLLARALHTGLLDGWSVAVKAHPYLPVRERLRALLGRRTGEVRLAEGAIAGELKSGVLVWASNSTTVALEAALKGLPVMTMLPVDDFDLCPLQDLPDLPRTGNLEDVRRALATAAPLDLPPAYLDLDPDLPRWKALLGLEAEGL